MAANFVIEGCRLCMVGRKLTTLAFIVFEWVKIIAECDYWTETSRQVMLQDSGCW